MTKLLWVPAIAAIALVGCVDQKAAITGTTSIRVDLVSPDDPGDVNHRLANDQRTITVNLSALLPGGAVDTSYTSDVSVYVQYLGTLTPALGAPPLMTFHMTNGVAMNQTVDLPPTFGPTTLWIDDDQAQHPTYATGTSPTLWYEDPTIADVQTPTSETALDALLDSPLSGKQVTVNGSRYGANGRLVVTSVFSQGYTVLDVNCSDAQGTPPCTSQPYDSLEVFSFSQPADQNGNLLKQGQLIDGFSGGISDFNGLTEVGFPVTMTSTDDATVDDDRIPAPTEFTTDWFGSLSKPNGKINFERYEAGLIEVKNAVVCQLDDDFDTFGQWKLDPSGQGGDCSGKRGTVINVVTAGVISDLDPTTLVGQTLPSVVGVLRSVDTIPVWIIYPRSSADITQQ
jgi:hypothetical protein